jgi:thiol-disulfide isomerase/thioredoxin
MKKITQFMIALACLVMPVVNAGAAELAKNFVITNRATGKPISREDFKGKILFLDFFAYWCPPCQESSPKVETDIAAYYKTKGGNSSGVKVEVIGVNIEKRSPALTDKFIKNAGLETVANDFSKTTGAWAQFGKRSIPHFVIINGTENSSYLLWEVLHSAPGFRGSDFYRNLIDSIKPNSTGPKITVTQSTGNSLIDGATAKGFGKVVVNRRGMAQTFTIKNMGNVDVSGLGVKKGGLNSGDFIVSKVSKITVKPGETATFKVTFKPKLKGDRRAVIRIVSEGSKGNPFDIKLTGKGLK